MNARHVIVGLSTILCISAVTGCDGTDDDPATETFEIGVIIPRTGSAASAGESVEAGINLAVADVNAYLEDIGDPLRIETVFRDSETDPATALEQAKNLHRQGVRHIIGPYSSANAAAVLDYADENGIVLLSPSSVASELAVADDNLFRLAPADTKQAEAISALFDHNGISAIVPVVRNDVWGNGLLNDLKEIAGRTGLEVRDAIFFDPANLNSGMVASDVATSLAQVLQQRTTSEVAVYLLSFGEGTDILEAAAGESVDALVRWYGSSAFALSAGLAENDVAATFATQQIFRCPSFAPDPAAADLWEPFSARLESVLGREPEVYALTSGDAVWLMTDARREQEGKTDIDSFKSALVQVAKHRFGITGRLVFNEYGDREQSDYDFWGLREDEGTRKWKSFGQFSNTGQLIIY